MADQQRTINGVPIPDGAVALDPTGSVAAVAEVCRQRGIPFLAVLGVSELVETDQDRNRAKREEEEFKQAHRAFSASRMTAEDAKRFQATLAVQVGAAWSRFEAACQQHDWKAVRAMLERKEPAVDTVRDRESLYQPLHMVARHGGGAELVGWMVRELRADVDAKTFNGKRPLHYAAASFEAPTVAALLACGAYARAFDNAGLSALSVMPPDKAELLWQNAGFRAEIEPKVGSTLAPLVARDPTLLADVPRCMRAVVQSYAARLVQPLSSSSSSSSSSSPSPSPSSSSSSSSSSSTVGAADDRKAGLVPMVDVDDGLCVICSDRPADTIVYPCRCCIVCKACSVALRSSADAKTCVRCRRPIERIDE